MATRKCGNIHFPEIFYGCQAVFYSFFSQNYLGWRGQTSEKFRQVHNLKISVSYDPRVYFKKIFL